MEINTKEVYLELKEIGCCSRCCLRFTGQKFANFEEPEKSLQELIPELDEEYLKPNTNTCAACLGLLQNDVLNQLLILPCWKNIQDHETDVYRINFVLPPSIAIREKGLKLHIKHKFSDFFKANNLEENIPQNNTVFKESFKAKLDKHCGRKFDTRSTYQLWITVFHEDNEKEVHVLDRIDPFVFRKRKYLGDKVYGKNVVNHTLSTSDEYLLLKTIEVPPTIPISSIRIDSVTVETLPIFICGRYCKYSRELSQTPWHLDCAPYKENKRKNVEELEPNNTFVHCVQDFIFDGIHEVFGFEKEKMTFTASGREDTDVRCLGSGRPFYVKIDGIKRNFPQEMFRKLEETVNNNAEVSIFDMQHTDRDGTKEIKFGEEKKSKTYIVLCLIRDQTPAEEIVRKINEIGLTNLEIQQTTPIRVAHRRSLLIRKKNIHFMHAEIIESNRKLFQLTMQTQAGTYVKEFIHGDFQRTSPCLASLVQADVDIFRLDVVGIDLNWPKHINSVPHQALKMLIS